MAKTITNFNTNESDVARLMAMRNNPPAYGSVIGYTTTGGVRTPNYARGSGNPGAPQPSTSSGGGGGGGSEYSRVRAEMESGKRIWDDNVLAALQQTPSEPQIDFDALIAPALDALSAYEPVVQSEYNTTVGGIGTTKANQLASLNQNLSGQSATLNRSKTEQQNLSGKAINQQRQGLSEIQQGLQARYGGTTGTGAFASEIAGRGAMQNIGSIQQGLAQAMQTIDDKLVQVREVGRIAAQDIEDKAAQQIKEAKNSLDRAMADIRSQKAALQSHKAELAMQAMQIYQNTVNNVKAQNASFLQNLAMQWQAAENNLNLAKQQAGQIASSYQGNTPSVGNQTTPVIGSTQPVNTSSIGGGQLVGFDSDRIRNLFGNYG